MDRHKFSSEEGLTLVEVVLSLALLAILSVVAFSIMQSTDFMMRRGTQEAQASQALRAAVEEIKGRAVAVSVSSVCGAEEREIAVDEKHTATYGCEASIHGLNDLYRIDVELHEGVANGPIIHSFSFLLTEGGY